MSVPYHYLFTLRLRGGGEGGRENCPRIQTAEIVLILQAYLALDIPKDNITYEAAVPKSRGIFRTIQVYAKHLRYRQSNPDKCRVKVASALYIICRSCVLKRK